MEMIIGFELILFACGIMFVDMYYVDMYCVDDMYYVDMYYVEPNFTFWSESHFSSTCNILL